NAPLERVTADILEFDRAVGVVLDFAARTPGTLVIVTADHETGGFSLVESRDDFTVQYTTRGHTAEMVPLFAFGPQASRFAGFMNNYAVGRTLFDIVRAWWVAPRPDVIAKTLRTGVRRSRPVHRPHRCRRSATAA